MITNTLQGWIPIPFNIELNKLRRARRDYFKTSVENYVQEMFGQINGILSLDTIPDFLV